MRNSNCDEEESTAFLTTEDDGSEDDTPLVLRVKTMGRGSSEGQYRIECVACPVLALLLVRTLFERASSSRTEGVGIIITSTTTETQSCIARRAAHRVRPSDTVRQLRTAIVDKVAADNSAIRAAQVPLATPRPRHPLLALATPPRPRLPRPPPSCVLRRRPRARPRTRDPARDIE